MTNKICLLIKEKDLNSLKIKEHYLKHINSDDVRSFSLPNYIKKPTAKEMEKVCVYNMLPIVEHNKVNILFIADSHYFKYLTKVNKTSNSYGKPFDCKIKGYEHIQCVLSNNYTGAFYNPAVLVKINDSLLTLNTLLKGSERSFKVLKNVSYPNTYETIKTALRSLHKHDLITCDIETFSLLINKAGLGTIGFSISQHDGFAFNVDYKPITDPKPNEKGKLIYGRQVYNTPIRQLILQFFKEYKGTIIYHNATFDVKILNFELFMKEALDNKGCVDGLDILCNKIEDTKLLYYVLTNTTAGNKLSLKDIAYEFTGNYAQEEIKDITLIAPQELLQYNLIDCCATYWVYNKYHKDLQGVTRELYYDKFIKSIKTLVHTETTGMCLDMDNVLKAEVQLYKIVSEALNTVTNSRIVDDFNRLLCKQAHAKDFEDRKAKAKNPDKIKPKDISTFDNLTFNVGSPKQLALLLHTHLGLDIIDTTPTGQPSVGADQIKTIINKLKYENLVKDNK